MMNDDRRSKTEDGGSTMEDGKSKMEGGRSTTEDRRGVSRREVLKAALVAPLAFVPFTDADAARAAQHAAAVLHAQAHGTPYVPKFFHADEWKQVRILVDLIIPRDERSGSATDAGVPEFMDFICVAYPDHQPWMRDGLRWLDALAYDSHHKDFAHCSDAERRAMLDQVAWPAKATPEMHEGVQFFNRIRDFTASGFFSSAMGVKDIGYIGNVAVPEWHGCPKPALDHLGVSYS
jgi:hypothetical protein